MDVETIHSNVALAAFSSDGNWMATVDERDDGQFQPEVFLKFWNWDQGSWCVNTRVDMPHKGRVKSMAMVGSGKTGAMAVTCGTDNKFKIWELVNSDDGERMLLLSSYFMVDAWSCRSIGGYKNLPASCVAFSPDGSIMAISYGQVVTLWDPSTSTLVRVLTYPADGVVRVEFSGKGAFLYARSPSRIYTWNLLTCALVIVRNIKKEVLSISADPASSNLLVATHACVMVYGPTDAEPLRIFSAEGDGMSGAEIIDAVHGEGVVYFLDKKYQITTFSLAEEKVIEVNFGLL
jgi:NET1-associated nuclear protein 1 (U3 small nucleolar RNA-associated protein 17)